MRESDSRQKEEDRTMNLAQKRKAIRKKKIIVIEESLRQFIPPVSRMGGASPPNWGWGSAAPQIKQPQARREQAKK